MVTTIKAIETEYLGFRFRSRLEARWACFFRKLGIRFQYELEGFDLGEAGRYLPDFWLPDHRCWVEIKPTYPDEQERQKLQALARGGRGEVFVFDRPDFQPPQMDSWAPADRAVIGAWGRRFSPNAHPDDTEGDFGSSWVQCTECIMEGVVVDEEAVARDGSFRFRPGRRTFGISGSDFLRRHMVTDHGWTREDCKGIGGCDDTADLVEAYRTARQARFEFGESGPR